MQIFNVTWKWNVPNALSLLRIALVPVFMGLYFARMDVWAYFLAVQTVWIWIIFPGSAVCRAMWLQWPVVPQQD